MRQVISSLAGDRRAEPCVCERFFKIVTVMTTVLAVLRVRVIFTKRRFEKSDSQGMPVLHTDKTVPPSCISILHDCRRGSDSAHVRTKSLTRTYRLASNVHAYSRPLWPLRTVCRTLTCQRRTANRRSDVGVTSRTMQGTGT